MPLYEYLCQACGKSFEVALSLDEYARHPAVACPRCHSSQRVERQLSTFHPQTSRKA
jgi:putative FmdB family regulatory protein